MKKKRSIHIGIAIAVIMLLVFLVLLSLHLSARDVFADDPPIAFSQDAWDTNPYGRSAMVKDLLHKYDFLSMTKDEVIDLLGTNLLEIGSETLGYETGGGFLEDQMLIFIFDESGKIIDVGLAN